MTLRTTNSFAVPHRKTHRPLLATDPDGTLRRLRSEREPHYRAVATLTVPTGPGPVEDVVTAILTHLEHL